MTNLDDNTRSAIRLAFQMRNDRRIEKLQRVAAVWRALAEARRVILASVPAVPESLDAIVDHLVRAGDLALDAIEKEQCDESGQQQYRD